VLLIEDSRSEEVIRMILQGGGGVRVGVRAPWKVVKESSGAVKQERKREREEKGRRKGCRLCPAHNCQARYARFHGIKVRVLRRLYERRLPPLSLSLSLSLSDGLAS